MHPVPRFDWYAATIREDVSVLLPTLADRLGGEVLLGKPKNGYAMGHYIRRDDSTIATVFSGGRNGNPHAFASGDDSPEFAEAVRELWPNEHHVTRMDACIDFDGPGTWDRLYAIVDGLAIERRLSISQAGDWRRVDEPDHSGRTYYIGSQKSAVFLRLYEKGKQLRGLAIDGGAGISPDLVRLEVVVRPDGPARVRAASGAPVEAFGYSDWSKELLRLVEGTDVDRVHIKERRESDHERAMHWLIRQYGEHLNTEAENVGGWENLGVALRDRFAAARDLDEPEPDLGPFAKRGRDRDERRPF